MFIGRLWVKWHGFKYRSWSIQLDPDAYSICPLGLELSFVSKAVRANHVKES